ncbi:DUF6090 family protein [Winogradskyella aquimaris]|uniref:DUF6090 family protein n=1 Tax=Winogradskyella aquimaris TaxID=864074 RepID=A0ABU5EPY9_9FLAO|nr:DUF6090 family protein [Winogradskyella aquimaris]MDY2587570.1 DUF6090 family protein [Winogradskyella aquimaris]
MQNKTGKYLKYAIGEIVLVVIGILIALQINNWNENRKQDIKEVEILSSIHESLIQDKIELERVIPSNNRIRNSIDVLLNHIEKNLPYQDSLSYHFFNSTTTWVPTFQKSAFETLKSEGLKLVSNKNLRKAIVEYYDTGIESSNWQFETYRTIVINYFQNTLNTRFESFWDSNYNDFMLMRENGEVANPIDVNGKMVPHNFELLKKDKEYLYFLRSLKNINSWHMDRVLKLNISSAEKLINDIESALENLK